MNKKTLRVDTFLKMLFRRKNLLAKEVAEKLGKTPECFSGILRHGSLKLLTLIEIMEVCGEGLFFQLGGEKMQIKKEGGNEFMRLLLINNNMNMTELARKNGSKSPYVSKLDEVEKWRLSRFLKVMEALNEPFVIVLSTGELIELELKTKE